MDVNKDENNAPGGSQGPRQSRRRAENLPNLKGHIPGPGRAKGSRNRFNQEAITNFVHQYRNDLAADWEKHGAEFVAKCREMFPQIYASMQVKRLEDELSRAPEQSGPLVIRWQTLAEAGEGPPQRSEPPKQIPYVKPQRPADLTDEAWGVLCDVLELIKRTIPTNSDRPPEEVFGVLKKALLVHFEEK